jgi:hypothetical protein
VRVRSDVLRLVLEVSTRALAARLSILWTAALQFAAQALGYQDEPSYGLGPTREGSG